MRIIDCIRPDKQTVMFSATFPRQMEALARKILTKPIEVRYFITRMSTLKKKNKKKKQFNRNTNVWFLLKKSLIQRAPPKQVFKNRKNQSRLIILCCPRARQCRMFSRVTSFLAHVIGYMFSLVVCVHWPNLYLALFYKSR